MKRGAFLALALTACSSNVTSPSRPAIDQGELGPVYEITTPESGYLGMVKVFTDGADRYDHGMVDRVALHVGFWVSNESFEALELHPGFLAVSSSLPRNGFQVELATTPDDEKDLVVTPGERRQIDTYAYVPIHVLPDDIDAFQVRWAVRARRSGVSYTQRTPFLAVFEEPQRGRRFAPAVDMVFYEHDELPAVTTSEIP